MAQDLRGKVIVITGASSGIGAATAIAAGQAGMRVVLAARRLDRLHEVAARITQAGGQALPVGCDVDRDEDVGHLVGAAVGEFGRLDVMFANAGRGLHASVLNTSDAQWRAIFETNFFGTVRCVKAAVPIMLELAARRGGDDGSSGASRGGIRGTMRGHVVINSSVVSKIGVPMNSAYCATKAAQEALGSALRAELAPQGVYVSVVYPIGTRTEFVEQIVRESGRPPAVVENTPSFMIQSPQHVARAVMRCLRRPRPQVWPHLPTRFALAIATAFPSLAAAAMQRRAWQ